MCYLVIHYRRGIDFSDKASIQAKNIDFINNYWSFFITAGKFAVRKEARKVNWDISFHYLFKHGSQFSIAGMQGTMHLYYQNKYKKLITIDINKITQRIILD